MYKIIHYIYSTDCSGADQSKHQSSASLAFVRGIQREPVNFPHKWSVTGKMFPFDDIMCKYKKLGTYAQQNLSKWAPWHATRFDKFCYAQVQSDGHIVP